MSLRLRRHRGFTLLEIMIVVAIVSFLTALALFTIGRIKERTARSLIENNLRQLYDAKEFYYLESGNGSLVFLRVLQAKGYLSNAAYARLTTGSTLEAKLGWHYLPAVLPSEPVLAYRGRLSPTGVPLDEVIYYPAPPSRGASGGTTPIVTPPVVNPPVVNPPVVNPPVVNPPVVTPPTVSGGNPPATTSTPSGNSGGGNVAPQQPNPPKPSNGPGNSDFGHSHQNNNPGHGNSHSGGKGKG